MDYIQVMSVVWMGVGGILLIYTLISYGYLRFKVRDAVKYDSGINVLSYRRPGLWITVIAVALVIFVAACFFDDTGNKRGGTASGHHSLSN